MGGGLPKYAEILEAEDHGSEDTRKDRSKGAGLGRYVHGGGTVGALIRQRELSCDQGDSQGPESVPPSRSAMDHRDESETRDMQRVGVSLGSGVNESRGSLPHQGVHQEAEEKHKGVGVLPPHL